MIKKLCFAVIILATTLISGCASVPMASAELDAQAKQFAPAADKSKIYIYRDESLGAAVKMPVLLNGMSVGDTVAKSYILREVDPGEHTITSKTENDATLTLKTEAGAIYYVWQEVKMGTFSARSALHQVEESKGKAAVQKCKLIQ